MDSPTSAPEAPAPETDTVPPSETAPPAETPAERTSGEPTPPTEPPTAHMPPNDPLPAEPEPFDSAQDKPTPEPPSSAAPAPTSHIRDLLTRARVAIQDRKRKKRDKIMQALNTKNKITNDEVEKLLHVSDATATRYLSALEKEGKVKQVGKTGAGVTYQKV